jgi:benzodiazapine receptor
MKLNKGKLAAAIGLCLIVGFVGSIFTTPAIPTWYATINKPTFNPPSWVFAPVWTTLYVLMGVALYLVWEKGLADKKVKLAVSIFGLQLILNSLWSALFFGLQNPFYAFIEIIFLWLTIAANIRVFWSIDKKAGLLLIPYLLWVSFASVLNYFIWQLNM